MTCPDYTTEDHLECKEGFDVGLTKKVLLRIKSNLLSILEVAHDQEDYCDRFLTTQLGINTIIGMINGVMLVIDGPNKQVPEEGDMAPPPEEEE